MSAALFSEGRVLESTGASSSHHDQVNSDVSIGTRKNESHVPICHMIENRTSHLGVEINQQGQAWQDRKASMEKTLPTYLVLDIFIFYIHHSPTKRRYKMKVARRLRPSSQRLLPYLQEVLFLGFTDSEQTTLKLNPKRLMTSPWFLEKFLKQMDTLSFSRILHDWYFELVLSIELDI